MRPMPGLESYVPVLVQVVLAFIDTGNINVHHPRCATTTRNNNTLLHSAKQLHVSVISYSHHQASRFGNTQKKLQ